MNGNTLKYEGTGLSLIDSVSGRVTRTVEETYEHLG